MKTTAIVLFIVAFQVLSPAFADNPFDQFDNQAPRKIPSWSEVVANPKFQSLTDAQKEMARQQYFSDVIAPYVPAVALESVRKEFDRATVGKFRPEDLKARIGDWEVVDESPAPQAPKDPELRYARCLVRFLRNVGSDKAAEAIKEACAIIAKK